MTSAARDTVPVSLPPPPPPPPRGNAVYLHQLYRHPEQPPPPEQQFVRGELMFFCGALKWGILVFLSVTSFVVLMWLVFHPTFPQLNVASASISTISINATAISAQCNITLLLTNTNPHLTTVYDRMEISLFYAPQQVLLSQLHQPQIVQPKRSRIALVTNLSFSGVNVGSALVSAMKQDMDFGSLGLGMKISAGMKYRNGKWKSKSHFMRAYCGGVSFAFTSSNRPGIFLNPYQECEDEFYTSFILTCITNLGIISPTTMCVVWNVWFPFQRLSNTGASSDHETPWFVTPNKKYISIICYAPLHLTYSPELAQPFASLCGNKFCILLTGKGWLGLRGNIMLRKEQKEPTIERPRAKQLGLCP